MVRHAYENVPYYRRFFDEHGCRPQDVQSIEDLVALPITTKGALRAAPREDRMAGRAARSGMVRHLTSGSTAQPSEVWRSAAEETLLGLFRLRAYRQFGIRARDRSARLSIGQRRRQRTLAGRLAGAAGLYRSEKIACTQPIERIVARLERAAPEVVTGLPSTLALLAPHLPTQTEARAWPRLLYAGGETIGTVTRRRIEEGFGARLFEVYGTVECNTAAWECPELGHLHVCDDNVALEVLRDGAPVGEGEMGEVVVTSLHSFAMPFIRHSLGDLAVRGPDACPCGQPFSTLQSVQGRVSDYFHLPGGRSIHPFAITDPLLLDDWTWVGRHQMAQEAHDRVVLRICPLRDPRPAELERIQRLGDDTFGPTAGFRIELVEDLSPQPGGRWRSYLPLAEPGSSGNPG